MKRTELNWTASTIGNWHFCWNRAEWNQQYVTLWYWLVLGQTQNKCTFWFLSHSISISLVLFIFLLAFRGIHAKFFSFILKAVFMSQISYLLNCCHSVYQWLLLRKNESTFVYYCFPHLKMSPTMAASFHRWLLRWYFFFAAAANFGSEFDSFIRRKVKHMNLYENLTATISNWVKIKTIFGFHIFIADYKLLFGLLCIVWNLPRAMSTKT